MVQRPLGLSASVHPAAAPLHPQLPGPATIVHSTTLTTLRRRRTRISRRCGSSAGPRPPRQCAELTSHNLLHHQCQGAENEKPTVCGCVGVKVSLVPNSPRIAHTTPFGFDSQKSRERCEKSGPGDPVWMLQGPGFSVNLEMIPDDRRSGTL